MEFMLEKFGPQDFDDYFRLVSDPKVMAMISERGIPVLTQQNLLRLSG
ncbi:hypothetical protein L537_2614 [Bordetella hinzii 1277]|nr:hypothetical protein [Bordetella hinzii]KCB51423.1 hypothetical protein L537_2614 [Bordetella hinzii 1277]